jgi:hypothetical protein
LGLFDAIASWQRSARTPAGELALFGAFRPPWGKTPGQIGFVWQNRASRCGSAPIRNRAIGFVLHDCFPAPNLKRQTSDLPLFWKLALFVQLPTALVSRAASGPALRYLPRDTGNSRCDQNVSMMRSFYYIKTLLDAPVLTQRHRIPQKSSDHGDSHGLRSNAIRGCPIVIQ